ncbi:MAG: GTP-binding protein [Candidatus Thorarchaeota archaeon]
MSSTKIKVILVGAPAVGKTSLIYRFVKGKFRANYKLTIGFQPFTKDVEFSPGEIATLTIWDIGGQERYEYIRNAIYQGTTGAFIIFDLTRERTYNEAKVWLSEIRRNRGNIPFCLIGNKADLLDDVGAAINRNKARSFAQNEESIYIETSAKTGVNVNEAFTVLTRMILEERRKEQTEGKRKEEKTRKQKEVIEQEYGQLPDKTREELLLEYEDLIKLKVKEMLESPSHDEFRFLIAGNEEAQKPLLLNTFHIEGIEWPPRALTILYNSSSFRMPFGSKWYDIELFFLSSTEKLNENQDLFYAACKNANGILLFYDPNDARDFKDVSNICMNLRKQKQFQNLEIILTTGTEEIVGPYQELKNLKKMYQIKNYEDTESLISWMLMNILTRKKEKKQEIKHLSSGLKKVLQKAQYQLSFQNYDPDAIVKDLNAIINILKENNQESAPKPLQEVEKRLRIFASYSIKDSDFFKVRDITKTLTQHKKIEKVLFFEGESYDNFMKYMNENIGNCDILLLFCSPNALDSKFVEEEWMTANVMGKPIVPIFTKSDHIPPLLKPRLGVEFDNFDLHKTIEEIYNIILKKTENRSDPKT